ncbi:ammonium transporter [Rubritalea sp.]|uniref:ammonium transporter n=1 Tax=Rubritalea sp. TaxID=2109375 RepID=UPI003EFA2055
MKKQTLLTTLLLWCLFYSSAYSQEVGAAALDKSDNVFILICAAMVFLMQAGFCLLEMGFSRAKNAINIVMKNACDMSVGSIGFFLVGFSLMFGWSQGGIVGLGNFGFSSDFLGSNAIWIFFLFQVMFAATTVTISSGAMAERTYFPGYLVYAAIACTFIYPILGHWVWGGASTPFGFGGGKGWLSALGFHDFAGSTVVHAVGGAFALAGIIVIGPRRGRFLDDGSEKIFAGHNIPLGSLGMFLLFFGWFGFNCGSNLSAGAEIGRIGVNTLLAGSGGLVAGLVFHWIFKGWADPESAINGALGGLVGITACCDVVAPWASILIGLISGFITVIGGKYLLRAKLDDAVGAIPVHLFCGIFGTLCVSIFNESAPFSNFGIQALGAFVVPVSAFAFSWFVFYLINKTIGLRASDEAQEQGLDFAEHSATAYPDFASNDDE